MRRSCLVSLRRVSTAAGGALTGTRVIELEGLAAAPLCGQLLAGHGAEVMRVDRPGRTPHAGTTLLSLGKSSVRIDLKSEKGRRSFEGLIRHADVLIEPYRPGVMERLRLGPDELLEINPRLIYARLTGWGQTGALAHTAGHDINYIATSGALSMFGRPGERPVPPVNLLGDFCGGSLSCAFGISMALFERERSGRGQVIDAAMLDGAAFTTSFIHRLVAARQWDPARPGTNLLDGGAPFYDTYGCSDGKFVAVGCIEPEFFGAMVELLDSHGHACSGEPGFCAQHDPRTWTDMRAKLTDIFASRTRDEWADVFRGTDACVSPVLSLTEAPDNAHNDGREIFALGCDGAGAWVAPPPKLSRTPARSLREMVARHADNDVDTKPQEPAKL
jgi:alpha-methylacyl-CoA racemase